MRNDTHLFYSGIIAPTANYVDNAFKLALGSTRMVKVTAIGGTAQVSFNGGNDTDMDLVAGETIELEHFQTSKIAVKGGATSVRIWAY